MSYYFSGIFDSDWSITAVRCFWFLTRTSNIKQNKWISTAHGKDSSDYYGMLIVPDVLYRCRPFPRWSPCGAVMSSTSLWASKMKTSWIPLCRSWLDSEAVNHAPLAPPTSLWKRHYIWLQTRTTAATWTVFASPPLLLSVTVSVVMCSLEDRALTAFTAVRV